MGLTSACTKPLKRERIEDETWVLCPECGAHDYFLNPSKNDAELRPYLCAPTTDELLHGLDNRT
jgi:hypothetical protein